MKILLHSQPLFQIMELKKKKKTSPKKTHQGYVITDEITCYYPGKNVTSMAQNFASEFTILVWKSWMDFKKEHASKKKKSNTTQISEKDYLVIGNFKWNGFDIKLNWKI